MDFERLVLSLDYVLPGWNWRSPDIEDSYAVLWAVYLCQICGVDFGYIYTWPPVGPGPYCGALAGDLEDLTQQEIDTVRNNAARELVGLTQLAKSKLEQVVFLRDYLCTNRSEPASLDQRRWLGLLAAVHYLRHFAHRRSGKAPTNSVEKLSSDKMQEWVRDELQIRIKSQTVFDFPRDRAVVVDPAQVTLGREWLQHLDDAWEALEALGLTTLKRLPCDRVLDRTSRSGAPLSDPREAAENVRVG